jgi:hypothetical protein
MSVKYIVCAYRPGMDCSDYESTVKHLRVFDDLAVAELHCATAQGYADRFYRQDMPVGWEEDDPLDWLDQQHWMIDAIVRYECQRRLEAEGLADNKYKHDYDEDRYDEVTREVEHEVGSFFNPEDPGMWGHALCRPEYFVETIPAN